MREAVAIAKEADAKKGVSPTNTSIHRAQNEPERQLGSLRRVIGNIRRDGGTPSVESIATELSGMPTAQRAPALLALQQTHGNRYVQRVVSGIQAKLVVGQPGDKYEQEADRVADAVMRMPEPQVQRQPEEEDLIQTKPLVDQITPLVQRSVEEKEEEEELLLAKNRVEATPEVTHDLESQINAIRGGGKPLSESERAYFEPRFGADFGQVRLHTGAQAAESARVTNARAFTLGQDVVFGVGQYTPETVQGKKLLAHELTHVVQQVGGQIQRQALAGQIGQDVSVSLHTDDISIQREQSRAASPSRITLHRSITVPGNILTITAIYAHIYTVLTSVDNVPHSAQDSWFNSFNEELQTYLTQIGHESVVGHGRHQRNPTFLVIAIIISRTGGTITGVRLNRESCTPSPPTP